MARNLTQQEIDHLQELSLLAARASGQPLEEDSDGDGERGRDKNWGTYGPVMVDRFGNTHVWKPRANDAKRGRARHGYKAADFMAEAAFTNTKTTPLFEVPAVIIETMRISNPKIVAHDLATYWFLFAHARVWGMEHESHSIKLSTIRHYLGVRAVARVVAMLERLAATEVSYHFNQEGHHGRKSMPLIQIVVPEGKLLGDSEIVYSLPEAVRFAALEARGHAWISLNALPRLTSRCSFPVFMRLAHKAGQLAEVRNPLVLSEEDLADVIETPMKLGKQEINRRIDCVVADIQALDRSVRRFDVSFDRIVYEKREDKNPLYEDGTPCVRFIAGSSAKKLKEVKPCAMSKDFWKLYQVQTLVPKKWTPHLTLLRQAATVARVPLNKLFQCWDTDIREAQMYGYPAAGLEGEDFIRWLDVIGPDRMLEQWVEVRDLGDLVFGKVFKDLKAAAEKETEDFMAAKYGPTPALKSWTPDFKKKRAALPQPVPVVDVEEDENDLDDYSMGDDYDCDHYSYA